MKSTHPHRLHRLEVEHRLLVPARGRRDTRRYQRLANAGVGAPHAKRGGLEADVSGGQDGVAPDAAVKRWRALSQSVVMGLLVGILTIPRRYRPWSSEAEATEAAAATASHSHELREASSSRRHVFASPTRKGAKRSTPLGAVRLLTRRVVDNLLVFFDFPFFFPLYAQRL